MVKRTKRLVYVTDEEKGYIRKKVGRGHVYYDPGGNKIDKVEIAERLKGLVIPPNWKDVWISTRPNGHLQVTGYDEKGRKQYLYHPDWLTFRNANKFNKLIAFAKKLPHIRKRVKEDLQQDEWTKIRVQALVLRVLDESFIRIGNRNYLEENNTYGLTTLRRRHLKESEEGLVLNYQAKSGKQREVNIEQQELVGLIKECSELPGYEIFRYQEGGKGKTVDSEDINDYLHEIAGEEFSSKDFRTWGGTVTAIEEFEAAMLEVEENPKKEIVPTLVKRVAERLGNTPAVCREYYIHPAVLETAEQGLLAQIVSRSRAEQKDDCDLKKTEKITLRLLEKYAEENELVPVLKEK
jgi:DNA topoisomerase-1